MGRQYIEPMAPAPAPAPAALGPARAWAERVLSACPGRCLVCECWTLGALCHLCQARFAQRAARCQRCALPWSGPGPCGHCLRDPPAHQHAVAWADYAFPWDRLIARLKFQNQPELARPLGQLLAQAVSRPAQRPRPDWVLPIPLSPARLAERGYNQAWALARQVAQTLGLPAQAGVLQRWRDGAHQVGASRAQRLQNLQDAFGLPAEARQIVAGRHLALVDDVLTTGVTAAAASQVLLRAGAASVQVWVLCRTPAPGD